MLKKMYKCIVISFLLFVVTNNYAQVSISGNADFVSRYLWRGLELEPSFSVQPGLVLSTSGFEMGFWGSYPFSNTQSGSEEMDLYLGYSYSDFSIILTDYYFPNAGLRYGLYKEPGAHTIELGLAFAGNNNIPISLAAFMNVYNDDDNSVYLELGYSTEISDVGIDLFVGGTPGGDNRFYGTKNPNIINIGLTATKEISLSDNFSLPIFSSYVVNPNLEIGYLIFGLSIGM
jgi:hypothetical protein